VNFFPYPQISIFTFRFFFAQFSFLFIIEFTLENIITTRSHSRRNTMKHSSTQHKRSLWSRICEDKHLLIMLLPTIILLILFCYLPFYGLVIAFQNYKVGAIQVFSPEVEWVGLKHFIAFTKSIFFGRVFGNTIRLSLESILCGFWVPIVFALLLNEIKISWYKKITQTFVYLPYFISTAIVVSMLMTLTASTGVFNRLITALGMESIPFMQSPAWFDVLYVGSGIWQNFGYSSIIYLAAIASTDPSLYEAATVDGANRFHKMWHITIPTILPTIVILLVLEIGGVLGSYTEKVLLMYNPSVMDRADVIGTYVYRTGLVNLQYSYTTAVGLFINIINFILVFGANTLAKKLTDYSLW